jgi:hypothetical protein
MKLGTTPLVVAIIAALTSLTNLECHDRNEYRRLRFGNQVYVSRKHAARALVGVAKIGICVFVQSWALSS